MSRAELLRGFVTRRLAAAAREILAVVDRIVSGYEEEAAGFRREIGRQQEQLERLQGRTSAGQVGMRRSLTHIKPVIHHNHAFFGVRDSFCPVEEEEGDEEEQQPEHPEDSTDETPPRCRRENRKPGRPQVSGTRTHVDLRIRILEDSQTHVLSNNVLKRSPVLELRCPRGLREPDFVALLRSSFPQLTAGGGRFDVLTADKRRRLKPLRVKALTAEEIQRSAGGSGAKWTLYIRLKQTKKEPQTGEEEEENPRQTNDVEESLQTSDEAGLHSSSVQEEEDESIGSTSRLQDMETEEADDEEDGTAEPAQSRGRGDDDDVEKEEEEASRNDVDWKPDNSVVEPRGSDAQLQSETTREEKTGAKRTEKSGDVRSCKVCGALLESEAALVKHDAGGVCSACGELSASFSSSGDALRHHGAESFLDEPAASSSVEKPHKCDVCRNAFASKASLEDHQKRHKAGKLNRCHTSHKAFAQRDQLAARRGKHTSKKTHLCGVCGKSLSDYRSLTRHKMTHSGERPHGCQVCGRRFKLPGTLRQHEKIHADRERSYLCDVCCKMFLTSKQLQIHLRTHSDEKPYHCGECGRGFTTKGSLTIHMRVHTGETPYRCPDCGWAFKRKINLDNHVTIHSGLKPFVCGICGKACARKSYLTVHMRTHNGERPYKCLLCDKAFTQSHCLKTHMKSHLVAEAAT